MLFEPPTGETLTGGSGPFQSKETDTPKGHEDGERRKCFAQSRRKERKKTTTRVSWEPKKLGLESKWLQTAPSDETENVAVKHGKTLGVFTDEFEDVVLTRKRFRICGRN